MGNVVAKFVGKEIVKAVNTIFLIKMSTMKG